MSSFSRKTLLSGLAALVVSCSSPYREGVSLGVVEEKEYVPAAYTNGVVIPGQCRLYLSTASGVFLYYHADDNAEELCNDLTPETLVSFVADRNARNVFGDLQLLSIRQASGIEQEAYRKATNWRAKPFAE